MANDRKTTHSTTLTFRMLDGGSSELCNIREQSYSRRPRSGSHLERSCCVAECQVNVKVSKVRVGSSSEQSLSLRCSDMMRELRV
jgi:hypothetical protein